MLSKTGTEGPEAFKSDRKAYFSDRHAALQKLQRSGEPQLSDIRRGTAAEHARKGPLKMERRHTRRASSIFQPDAAIGLSVQKFAPSRHPCKQFLACRSANRRYPANLPHNFLPLQQQFMRDL